MTTSMACLSLDTMALGWREIDALREENSGPEDDRMHAITFRFRVARRTVMRERAFGTHIVNVGRKLAFVD